METLIRVMLSVFLIGMVVATIVFFSVFGLLPAEKLTQVLQGEPPEPSGTSTIVVSTTTIIERVIERPAEEPDEEEEPEEEEPPQEEEPDDQQEEEPSQDQEDIVEEQTTTTQSLPPAVFNTSGEVTSIEGNVIFVASDGSHMETIPASGIVDVEVMVTDSTNFLNESNNEITLSDIQAGDPISIEASGNIKNQLEFEASNIRITN